MTGTGTQADPFRPTNWDEFVTAVETSGAYVECPENTVWDMNNIIPQGLSRTINIKSTEIKGNALKIVNLRNDMDMFKLNRAGDCKLYDLYFENLYLKSALITVTATSGTTYRNIFGGCIFTGLSATTGYVFSCDAGYITTTTFTTSPYTGMGNAINIEAPNGGLFHARYQSSYDRYGLQIQDSYINFVGMDLTYYSSSTIQYRYPLTNCLVSGDFRKAQNINPLNSIFNCTCDSISGVLTSFSALVNKDKCPVYPSGAMAVTTEQLKDADYLRSLGFPIGV